MARMAAAQRDIRARLRQGVLVSDGATGTQLQAAGLAGGTCPEIWNLKAPDAVRAVCERYVAAGSEAVITNSIGGNTFSLAVHGLADDCRLINRRAAELAREGVGEAVYVFGSVGSTGRMLEPYGDLSEAEAIAAYIPQIEALIEGGVDAILVETIIALEEAVAALKAAASVAPDFPRFCTMSFGAGGRTEFGVTPEDAVRALEDEGVGALGANCGGGSKETLPVVERLAAMATVPVIAHPNAGLPRLEGGQTIFPETPAEMAAYAVKMVAAGARVVGGCCGSTPEHIRAIAAAVRA